MNDEAADSFLSKPPKTRFMLWLVFSAVCLTAALVLPKVRPSASTEADAEPPPLQYVQPGSLNSRVLGERRHFTVYLPKSYAAVQQHYPVLFLLDGPRHGGYATALAAYLAGYSETIPPIIIVDIAQQHRGRDMTPTPARDHPHDTGGADRFLAFLAQELVPHIQSHYRTKSPRVLWGHSLSGLFVFHALLTEPELFDGYITASPSLWWDDSLLVRRADDFFKSRQTLDGKLFFGVGADERQAVQDYFNQMNRIFDAHTPKGFQVSMRRFEGEGHGTICIPTTYNGLKFIFGATGTNAAQLR